ncbi:MAG TPA: class I SAM-dependent methyltransferase [Xanthobacteraceae bacterium]|nr:class I SAM-dependent methyltransferase [Xanthobacteraceae bacterium]
MRQLWINEDKCVLDDVPFTVGKSNFSTLKTTDNNIFVLKGQSFFNKYDGYFGPIEPHNVLEVGIFEGGSAILLADKWSEAKIVGIDIRDPNPSVAKHIATMGFSDRISLHYNVSQNDANRVTTILDKEFGKEPIDIVIDDCSHLYDLTKATFNTVFPRLKPGGYYVVEDWAWAHWRDWQDGTKGWPDQPALTNLLFEIIMTSASSSWLISDIYVNSNFFIVKKAESCPALQNFNLDKNYLLRGKPFARI